MRAPEVFARCEVCDEEHNCHDPDEVRLHVETWLCYECYSDWEDSSQTHWASLPQASEWVAVREAPAEKQEILPIGVCPACLGKPHMHSTRGVYVGICVVCNGTGEQK